MDTCIFIHIFWHPVCPLPFPSVFVYVQRFSQYDCLLLCLSSSETEDGGERHSDYTKHMSLMENRTNKNYFICTCRSRSTTLFGTPSIRCEVTTWLLCLAQQGHCGLGQWPYPITVLEHHCTRDCELQFGFYRAFKFVGWIGVGTISSLWMDACVLLSWGSW